MWTDVIVMVGCWKSLNEIWWLGLGLGLDSDFRTSLFERKKKSGEISLELHSVTIILKKCRKFNAFFNMLLNTLFGKPEKSLLLFFKDFSIIFQKFNFSFLFFLASNGLINDQLTLPPCEWLKKIELMINYPSWAEVSQAQRRLCGKLAQLKL